MEAYENIYNNSYDFRHTNLILLFEHCDCVFVTRTIKSQK